MLYYFAILLTIISNIFYHLSQKVVPNNVNPIISLIVTYFVSIVGCIVLLPFFPLNTGLIESFKRLNWGSYVLGLALIGLELGFLLAYRAGWSISFAGAFSNVAVTLLLIPIGILLFKESVTLTSGLGVAFCILGLILINLK